MHRMKGWLHGHGAHGAGADRAGTGPDAHQHGHGWTHGWDRAHADRGYEPGDEDHPPSGRHPVNVAHLVMGVAFLGIVVVWALLASETLELAEARWLVPVPFLAAGALGLVASVAAGARRRTGP